MLASITRACAQRGYDLLISFQQPANEDWQASFEDSNKADGIILLGYGDYQEYRARLKFLISRGIHFVRWGAKLPDQADITVGCDNYHGGYAITRHLLERGAPHPLYATSHKHTTHKKLQMVVEIKGRKT